MVFRIKKIKFKDKLDNVNKKLNNFTSKKNKKNKKDFITKCKR